MKSLKRLGVALALTFVLGVTALAGETPTPPCAPGETPTPPCANAQLITGDSLAPGQTNTPPAASENEYSFAAAAIDLLQSVLLNF
jgi:hypothetical protein